MVTYNSLEVTFAVRTLFSSAKNKINCHSLNAVDLAITKESVKVYID